MCVNQCFVTWPKPAYRIALRERSHSQTVWQQDAKITGDYWGDAGHCCSGTQLWQSKHCSRQHYAYGGYTVHDVEPAFFPELNYLYMSVLMPAK